MASHMENDSSSASAGFQPVFKSFATEAIHVGSEPEQWNSMAVVPPISLATTFKQHGPGKHAVSCNGLTLRIYYVLFPISPIFQCRLYVVMNAIGACTDRVNGERDYYCDQGIFHLNGFDVKCTMTGLLM